MLIEQHSICSGLPRQTVTSIAVARRAGRAALTGRVVFRSTPPLDARPLRGLTMRPRMYRAVQAVLGACDATGRRADGIRKPGSAFLAGCKGCACTLCATRCGQCKF